MARAQYVIEDVHDKERFAASRIILPFIYYDPAYSGVAGAVFQSSGHFQPQSSGWGVAFSGLNGSYGAIVGEDDIQVRPIDRLFVDTEVAYVRTIKDQEFISGNLRYRHEFAGKNRSSEEDFLPVRTRDYWADLTFKYLLPIGDGRETVIDLYKVDEGMLVSGASGGHGWNPLQSGRTELTVQPFFEHEAIGTSPREHADENGLRFGFIYDNTDFPLNPTNGNVTRFTFSRDFGLFSSPSAWSHVSGEVSQFVYLGHSPLFKQQVLALDGWTSYSLTWKEVQSHGLREIEKGPPFYDGAVLGGDTRLRGFPFERFWDRAAIYGGAELRLVPWWNPFNQFELLKKADVSFLELVLFGEVGRVAGQYTPKIFSHLKGDSGVGLRLLAGDSVVRFDIAASNEGVFFWAQLNQPF